ncbi:hypothetical protein G9A89_013600 [Geosiphon pyriformis]|nr:hypothetical protein G9A89_013600 [Geosiphon pyriformis]
MSSQSTPHSLLGSNHAQISLSEPQKNDISHNHFVQVGEGKETNSSEGNSSGGDYDTNMSASDESGGIRSRESSSISNGNERELDESSHDTSSSDSKKSKTSLSTTEAWFREFNTNVKELNQSFDEDDSETPYFVNPYQKAHPPSQSTTSKNQSQSPNTNYHHHHRVSAGRDNIGLTRHNIHHTQNIKSPDSDSYRSVIDDLTLKNQKLRQKLHKLERLREKSLHKEKLFEVRYFQMPRGKRHELEDYLKDFAAQLPTPPTSGGTASSLNSGSRSTSLPWGHDNSHFKGNNKTKMRQVVQAIEKVFTTKPLGDDHYLKDQEDADPDGYVYLNLLTNMAQLHTMSVTLPFVKQSIRTFSNCLELSEDGTKVRWRSGLDPINRKGRPQILSNESQSISGCGNGEPNSSGQDNVEQYSRSSDPAKNPNPIAKKFQFSPSERSSDATSSSRHTKSNVIDGKSNYSANSKPSHQNTVTTIGSSHPSSIAHYLPRFPHRNNGSSSSSSSDENSNSIFENPQEGPIIYYEGGVFCTDLSRARVDYFGESPSNSSEIQTPPNSSEIENSTSNSLRKKNPKRPTLRYVRGTNIVLGSKPEILATDQEDESSSGQEADEEDSDQNVFSPDDSKLELTFVEKSETTESLIVDQNGNSGVHNGSSSGVSQVLSETSPSSINSSLQLPISHKLNTSGISGVIPEDNFTVLVKTSHPWSLDENQSSRRHRSLPKMETSLIEDELNINCSNKTKPLSFQKTAKSFQKQQRHSHSIVSTEFILLAPSFAPKLQSLPSAPKSRGTFYTNPSALGSSESGGSSGYGSSSSSQALSEMSYDPTYILKNNTILALSRNRQETSSPEDEIQDMDLDSPSSDSSTHYPYINIDEDDDDDDDDVGEVQARYTNEPTMVVKQENGYYHYHKSKIEESQLGMNLRLQEEATKERRKNATGNEDNPQDQRFKFLNNIVESSQALIHALQEGKSNGDQRQTESASINSANLQSNSGQYIGGEDQNQKMVSSLPYLMSKAQHLQQQIQQGWNASAKFQNLPSEQQSWMQSHQLQQSQQQAREITIQLQQAQQQARNTTMQIQRLQQATAQSQTWNSMAHSYQAQQQHQAWNPIPTQLQQLPPHCGRSLSQIPQVLSQGWNQVTGGMIPLPIYPSIPINKRGVMEIQKNEEIRFERSQS